VTEVPEHLLRRSKERRAALGLGGDGGGEGTGDSAAGSAPAPAAPPAGAKAGLETAPVDDAGLAAPPAVEEPLAPIVVPVPRRPGIPVFILPVLIMLPVWAFIYLGAFGPRSPVVSTDPLVLGNTTFHSVGCSGCHGANGEGVSGPALADVKHTFPKLADQISWVHTGSQPFIGKVYGNSGRISTGVMPAFSPKLSDAEIADVVCYERVQFGGGTRAADCPPDLGAAAAAGAPASK
jgi:mono/diheme cytochrome c family protein